MLNRHVLVLQPSSFLLGGVKQLPERSCDTELAAGGSRPADSRPAFERTLDRRPQGTGIDIGSRQQTRHEPLGLLEQRQQQVGGVDFGVAVAQRLGLRVVQRLLGLDG